MDNFRTKEFDYSTAGMTYANLHSMKHFKFPFYKAPLIGQPSKVKNERRATLSNHTFDFSLLYGHQVYTDRTIESYLLIYDRRIHSEVEVQFRKIQATNWLMGQVGRQPLRFDHIPGMYFMAEVVGEPKFDYTNTIGRLDIAFIAYPFMIDELPEHQNVFWDELRFATDVLQEYKHSITGTEVINMINAGTSHIIPTVESTADCVAVLRGDVIAIKEGSEQYGDLVLAPGDNLISITGNAVIEFQFNKELI